MKKLFLLLICYIGFCMFACNNHWKVQSVALAPADVSFSYGQQEYYVDTLTDQIAFHVEVRYELTSSIGTNAQVNAISIGGNIYDDALIPESFELRSNQAIQINGRTLASGQDWFADLVLKELAVISELDAHNYQLRFEFPATLEVDANGVHQFKFQCKTTDHNLFLASSKVVIDF